MSRIQTFLIAALEAAILVAIGLGLLLAPLTLVWILENDPNVDWLVAFRAAADFWLLSHGTRLVISGGEILGVEVSTFVISLVPLGMTLLFARLYFNAGKRFLAARALWAGWLGGLMVFGALALIIGATAYSKDVYPVLWQSVIFPTGIFMLFQVLGSLFGKPDDWFEGDAIDAAPERDWVFKALSEFRLKLHWSIRSLLIPALRAGTGITLMLLVVSSFSISVLIAINWIEITRLYESVQVSILGATVLTAGQLAILPNLIVFGAAWFTGAGFSIGAGSLISPLGSQVGPLPAVPILGALPVGKLEFGMIAIAVVLVASFLATLLIRKSADEIRFEFATPWSAAISLGLAIATVTSIQLMILAVVASGGAGPGRLAVIGVNPFVVGLVSFIEVAIISTLAAFFSARPEQPAPKKPRGVN